MLQPSPRAAPNTKASPEILKSDLHAVHRAVIEYEHISESRQYKNKQLHFCPTVQLAPLGWFYDIGFIRIFHPYRSFWIY